MESSRRTRDKRLEVRRTILVKWTGTRAESWVSSLRVSATIVIKVRKLANLYSDFDTTIIYPNHTIILRLSITSRSVHREKAVITSNVTATI